MHIGIHVQYLLLLSNFEETSLFLTDFRKIHQDPSSGSRVISWGRGNGRTDRRTDRQTDRQTDRSLDRLQDMTKLTVAFWNFAKTSKVLNGRLNLCGDISNFTEMVFTVSSLLLI